MDLIDGRAGDPAPDDGPEVGRQTVQLAWEGEVDLAQVPALTEQITGLPAGDVRLDLSGVSYVDSSGLHLLVQLRKRVLASGGRVTLVDVPNQLRRMMQITNLDGLFQAVASTSNGGSAPVPPAAEPSSSGTRDEPDGPVLDR